MGRLAATIEPRGTTTVGYDAAGHVTSVADPAGTLSYTYDPAGDVSSLATPLGTTTYGRDAAGRVITIGDPVGTITIDRRADGLPVAVQRPGGVGTAYTYDGDGRRVGIHHQVGGAEVAAYDYTLDAGGNPTSVVIADPAGNRTESYTLDGLAELTRVEYGDGSSQAFTYDAAGNRTSSTADDGSGPQTTTYGYDPAGQVTEVTAPDGSVSHPAYDAAGNEISDGAGSGFVYDRANNLVGTSGAAGEHQFGYEPGGLRVSVDGVGQLWDRQAPGGPAVVVSGDTRRTLVDEHGAGALVKTAGSASYDLADRLGSVRVGTDLSGSVTASTSYGVYGDQRTSVGSLSAGFTGGSQDVTGLTYLQHRYLVNATGRFLSADSVQPNRSGPLGWSWYGYSNRPTSVTDRSGHEELVECMIVCGEEIAMEVEAEEMLAEVAEELASEALEEATQEAVADAAESAAEEASQDAAEQATRGAAEDSGDAAPDEAGDEPRTCKRPVPVASFSPDTPVLMANGERRPISQVKVGDQVLATDPATGKTGARTVTATMAHDDNDLLDLTIKDGQRHQGVLQTTDHHQIWSATAGTWVLASQLHHGDRLREPDGSTATLVESTKRPGHEQMLDLTVQQDHTFYVDYGDGAILVHNVGGDPVGDCGGDPRCASNPDRGRFNQAWSSADAAIDAAQQHAGPFDIGQKMIDPATGSVIGEQSADGRIGWRIDNDHVSWWNWAGGKKGKGGEYGHDFFPGDEQVPHSEHIGYADWEEC